MSDHTCDRIAWRRKLGKISRIIGLVVLALLVLSCAILILQSILPIDRMPGLLRPSAQNNPSMSPTVKRGDFLLLGSPQNGIEVNDVVSYRTETGFVLGRVISADDTTVTVKGDAETDADAMTVDKNAVYGIWNGFRIPLLGYPILWVQTVPGFLLFVFVFLLLDLLISLLSKKKEKKKELETCGEENFEAGFAVCGALLLAGWLFLQRTIRKRSSRKGR